METVIKVKCPYCEKLYSWDELVFHGRGVCVSYIVFITIILL